MVSGGVHTDWWEGLQCQWHGLYNHACPLEQVAAWLALQQGQHTVMGIPFYASNPGGGGREKYGDVLLVHGFGFGR